MDDLRERLSKSIVLVLPPCLDGMIQHFTWMGFAIVHSFDLEMLEAEIKEYNADIGLEWQHGPEDYTVRDTIRKSGKEIPVLLVLNWNGKLPADFPSLGYCDYIKCPWTLDTFNEIMGKFYAALPESKKSILMALWETR